MHSSYRRGLIATSLDCLAPIGKLASSIGLSGTFDRTANFAVRKYQKYLSPRKGFSCAHARLHGGPSCSAYFRELLTTRGFTRAIQPFQQRLQECHHANLTIRAQRIQTIRTHRIQNHGEDESPQRKPNNPNNSDGDWCDFAGCGIDIAECGGDIFTKEIGNCDTPDCGLGSCDSDGCDILGSDSCDISGCDVGICDGCDVSGCDIGGCDGCDVGGCDCSF